MKNKIETLCFADLLAKSKGSCATLQEHTETVLKILDSEIMRYDRLLCKISEFSEISKESIVTQARIAGLTHDFGKATKRFQQYLRRESHQPYIHHRFASIPFTVLVNNAYSKRLDSSWIFLSFLAVITHHRIFSLNSEVFANDFLDQKQRIYSNFDLCESALDGIYDFIKNVADNYAWHGNIMRGELQALCLKGINIYNKVFLSSSCDIHDFAKYRLPFLCVKGLLQSADWQASGNWTPEDSLLDHIEKYIKDATIKRALDYRIIEKYTDFKWKPFQENMHANIRNTLGIAPCGSGKTEAALLWASNDEQSRHIVFLLPTQVTTNKVFDRIKNALPCSEGVGLLHGTARYHQFSTEQDDEELISEQRELLSRHRAFGQPITVATVDQALVGFFNAGYWTQSQLRLANSNIILDEIHSYEPYTLGLILNMVKSLIHFNSRFTFLSATMPEGLQNMLSDACNSKIDIIKDDQIRKPRWTLHDFTKVSIQEMLPDILKSAKSQKGLKVLIVVNNIAEAIEIYKSINGISKDLLHSAFMLKDRNNKENQLETNLDKNESFILVATQIVEVSLDIDFDVLYTEICPVDALVQRLGRVNRYGKHHADAYVCGSDIRSSRIYNSDYLELSMKLLFEGSNQIILTDVKYKDAVNKAFDWLSNQKEFEDDLQQGLYMQGNVLESIGYIYDLNIGRNIDKAATRPNDYPKVEIIPTEYEDGRSIEDEYLDACHKKEGLTQGMGYVVRIPAWWLHSSQKKLCVRPAPHGLLVNLKYSQQFGILDERTSGIY